MKIIIKSLFAMLTLSIFTVGTYAQSDFIETNTGKDSLYKGFEKMGEAYVCLSYTQDHKCYNKDVRKQSVEESIFVIEDTMRTLSNGSSLLDRKYYAQAFIKGVTKAQEELNQAAKTSTAMDIMAKVLMGYGLITFEPNMFLIGAFGYGVNQYDKCTAASAEVLITKLSAVQQSLRKVACEMAKDNGMRCFETIRGTIVTQ